VDQPRTPGVWGWQLYRQPCRFCIAQEGVSLIKVGIMKVRGFQARRNFPLLQQRLKNRLRAASGGVK